VVKGAILATIVATVVCSLYVARALGDFVLPVTFLLSAALWALLRLSSVIHGPIEARRMKRLVDRARAAPQGDIPASFGEGRRRSDAANVEVVFSGDGPAQRAGRGGAATPARRSRSNSAPEASEGGSAAQASGASYSRRRSGSLHPDLAEGADGLDVIDRAVSAAGARGGGPGAGEEPSSPPRPAPPARIPSHLSAASSKRRGGVGSRIPSHLPAAGSFKKKGAPPTKVASFKGGEDGGGLAEHFGYGDI